MPKAMLVDTSKCIGCRGCQVACKQWNGLPAVPTKQTGTYENPPDLSASTWTRIQFRGYPGGWLFRKQNCMHCTQASCVSVCPSGAAQHRGEFVLIDQERCVGCGNCVVACPFGSVHREPPNGTARKCTLCIDRVSNGLTPACAKTCPTGAIQFGERWDLIAAGHRRVATLASNGYPLARLYGETELGGLGQMYVLTQPAPFFGLPERPVVATANVLAHWLSGAVATGLIAALPFWLLFRRRRAMAAEGQPAAAEVTARSGDGHGESVEISERRSAPTEGEGGAE